MEHEKFTTYNMIWTDKNSTDCETCLCNNCQLKSSNNDYDNGCLHCYNRCDGKVVLCDIKS